MGLGAGPRLGVVATFDAARGLGSVSEAGGRSLAFHGTAVSDGSRSIEVGEAVAFVPRAAHRGTVEATFLVRLVPAGSADRS